MKRVFLAVATLACTTSLYAQESAPWDEGTTALGATQMPSGLQTSEQLETLRKVGRELFGANFTTNDGAGRPMATQAIIPTKPRNPLRTAFARTSGPDAHACSSCHNQPFMGGAGDFVTNVFVSEGFNNHDFNTTDPEFSNERGSNHLFGAGLVELLAREMTADLVAQRTNAIKMAKETTAPVRVALISKEVSFGFITASPNGIVDISKINGVDTDLVIRPFSQKGVMTSLRQFTINALNHHHGMQSDERWGARWTSEADFDEDGHGGEVTRGDVSALVAWQASLPAPTRNYPDNKEWFLAARTGEDVFDDIGCAECHRTAMPLNNMTFFDPGPLDVAGTMRTSDVAQAAAYDLAQLSWAKNLVRNEKGQIMVPLFGDLKRHVISDSEVDTLGNELLSQRFVGRDTFMTSELWGIGSTAPYGHRNDITTLDGVIRAHGGAGRSSRDAYVGMSQDNRNTIIAFLKTLQITEPE